MPRNFFLWKDISTSDKKFLPMTRNFFPKQEISSSVKINFFLWQLITCSTKNFLPVIRKYFLHVVCDRKNFFIWQEIQTLKSNLRQNSVKCCKNFVWVWRFCGNLAPWFPVNIPPWSRLAIKNVEKYGWNYEKFELKFAETNRLKNGLPKENLCT